MTDKYHRLGVKVSLEKELDELNMRLQGIAGSIGDALFVLHSHIDNPNAKKVESFGREYLDAWEKAQKIKKRLEELESQ